MSPDVLVVALASVLGLLVSPWLADRTDALIAERVEEPRPTSRPLVAFCCAFGFAVVATAIGPHGQLPAYLFLAAVLVVLSFVDIVTKKLPRQVVHAALAGGVVMLTPVAVATGEPERIAWAAVGAVISYGSLALLHLVLRGGLGWGDVRLGAPLGWFVGFQGLRYLPVALFLAFVLSAVVGIVLMLTRRVNRRTMVPFGPFMALGAVATLLLVPAA